MDVSTNTGQNTMYRDVIYASQSAIMTLTPVSWKYSFANPAALALFGAKTEEEFLTLYPWTLSPETQEDGRYSQEKAKEMIETAIRLGSHSFEWLHKRISGEVFYSHVLLSKVGEGDSSYVSAIVIDITERKKMELMLKESEERLRKAQLVAQVGNWELDLKTKTIWASEEAFRIYGIVQTSSELPLDVAQQSVLPEYRSGLDTALESLIRDGTDYNQEFKLKRKSDGVVRYIHSKAELYKDPTGKAVKVLGVIQDITESKSAEVSMRESQLILQNIIDLLPVRIFWKDTTLHYLGCNKAFAKDAGKDSPAELLGKDDFDMGWKDQADLYRADDMNVINTGVAKVNYEEPQTTPDGKKIWLVTNKVPLLDNNGKVTGVLGTYHDITNIKQTEDELSAKNLELETLNHSMVDRELKMIELKNQIERLQNSKQ